MIHDLDLSFAKDIDRSVIPWLKKWSGVGRTVDTGLLFRSRQSFGLGLTAVADHYQAMQLVKCQLLQQSDDDSSRALYTSMKSRQTKGRKWRASRNK